MGRLGTNSQNHWNLLPRPQGTDDLTPGCPPGAKSGKDWQCVYVCVCGGVIQAGPGSHRLRERVLRTGSESGAPVCVAGVGGTGGGDMTCPCKDS